MKYEILIDDIIIHDLLIDDYYQRNKQTYIFSNNNEKKLTLYDIIESKPGNLANDSSDSDDSDN